MSKCAEIIKVGIFTRGSCYRSRFWNICRIKVNVDKRQIPVEGLVHIFGAFVG